MRPPVSEKIHRLVLGIRINHSRVGTSLYTNEIAVKAYNAQQLKCIAQFSICEVSIRLP